ncbi:hypothetical protein K7X08_000962 [Anisodus acutangulus]|uniref:Uncharacterized protein n=1 Tax=Anisodus acutangulus TaxID=402998 RepID=A0A9Q1RMY2_9SOLA|nr:hypothetical protein K7X08_000962 [Anisodus acutangulus]
MVSKSVLVTSPIRDQSPAPVQLSPGKAKTTLVKEKLLAWERATNVTTSEWSQSWAEEVEQAEANSGKISEYVAFVWDNFDILKFSADFKLEYRNKDGGGQEGKWNKNQTWGQQHKTFLQKNEQRMENNPGVKVANIYQQLDQDRVESSKPSKGGGKGGGTTIFSIWDG